MEIKEKGSVELIVMGLIAALIVVLAIPLLTNIGKNPGKVLNSVDAGPAKAAEALPAH